MYQVSAWQSATLLPIGCKSVQPVPARVEEPVSPARQSTIHPFPRCPKLARCYCGENLTLLLLTLPILYSIESNYVSYRVLTWRFAPRSNNYWLRGVIIVRLFQRSSYVVGLVVLLKSRFRNIFHGKIIRACRAVASLHICTFCHKFHVTYDPQFVRMLTALSMAKSNFNILVTQFL